MNEAVRQTARYAREYLAAVRREIPFKEDRQNDVVERLFEGLQFLWGAGFNDETAETEKAREVQEMYDRCFSYDELYTRAFNKFKEQEDVRQYFRA